MSTGGPIPKPGSKVSLIYGYRGGLRYEGILNTGTAVNGTVTLSKVRLLGTEDRPTNNPRAVVFENLSFCCFQIKDWRVCDETPMPQQIDANATVIKFAVEITENFANYCCSKEL